MEILINTKNEIISFAIVGGFEDGIKVDNVPENFIINFKPRYYLYNEGQIEVNKTYEVENEVFPPINTPSPNNPGTDEELRSMFANMQIQIVEANTMIYEMSEQNARLAQEIVDIKSELNNTKGE